MSEVVEQVEPFVRALSTERPTLDELGLFGMLAMFVFLLNISLAYMYEWRRGGLDWD